MLKILTNRKMIISDFRACSELKVYTESIEVKYVR